MDSSRSPKAINNPQKREVNVIHPPQEPQCSCSTPFYANEEKSYPPTNEPCRLVGRGSLPPEDDDEDSEEGP